MAVDANTPRPNVVAEEEEDTYYDEGEEDGYQEDEYGGEGPEEYPEHQLVPYEGNEEESTYPTDILHDNDDFINRDAIMNDETGHLKRPHSPADDISL